MNDSRDFKKEYAAFLQKSRIKQRLWTVYR